MDFGLRTEFQSLCILWIASGMSIVRRKDLIWKTDAAGGCWANLFWKIELFKATPNFFLIACYDERLNEQRRSAQDVITDRQSRLMAVYIIRLAWRLLTLEDQQSKSFQHIISSAKLSDRHRITYLSLEIDTSIIHWSFQIRAYLSWNARNQLTALGQPQIVLDWDFLTISRLLLSFVWRVKWGRGGLLA